MNLSEFDAARVCAPAHGKMVTQIYKSLLSYPCHVYSIFVIAILDYIFSINFEIVAHVVLLACIPFHLVYYIFYVITISLNKII